MAPSAIGEILVQRDDLAHRVQELAAQVSRDYEGRSLLLIGVLKGAMFFLSDLMRQLDVECEVDFMAVASYGSSTSPRPDRAQSRRRGAGGLLHPC